MSQAHQPNNCSKHLGEQEVTLQSTQVVLAATLNEAVQINHALCSDSQSFFLAMEIRKNENRQRLFVLKPVYLFKTKCSFIYQPKKGLCPKV